MLLMEYPSPWTFVMHLTPVKVTRVHEAKRSPWCWHLTPFVAHVLGTTQPRPSYLQSREHHGPGCGAGGGHFGGTCSSAPVAGSVFIAVHYSAFPRLSTWALAQPC